MARAALKLGVRDVASLAKVSPATVTRIEADLPANAATLTAIRAALETAGVVFIPGNGIGPGVRLAKPQPVPAQGEGEMPPLPGVGDSPIPSGTALGVPGLPVIPGGNTMVPDGEMEPGAKG